MSSKQDSSGSRYLVYGFAVSSFGFIVLAGLWLGLLVDKKWGTMPLFLLLGIAAGFASGVRLMILMIREKKKDDVSDPDTSS